MNKSNKNESKEVVEGEVISNTKQSKPRVVKSSRITDLPFKQRKFVKNYIKTGNATKSAIQAGYSEHSAYSTGSRLLKSDKVLMVLENSIDLAQDTIKELMMSDESGAIRLAAAKETLDRTIGKPVQRSESVQVHISVETMLESE